jgi:hypothetical protein
MPCCEITRYGSPEFAGTTLEEQSASSRQLIGSKRLAGFGAELISAVRPENGMHVDIGIGDLVA